MMGICIFPLHCCTLYFRKCYSINAGCKWNVYLCLIWHDCVMFIILIKCCKYYVLCLLYITDTTPWQTICIRTTLKYNRSLEKHVLAHFQQMCSQIYFRFSSYLLGAPHLFVILTAIGLFIFWHRCLERQTFGTPRMYTLSPSKIIKESNYGEFLKDKNALLMYTTVLSLTSTLRIWKVCLHSNMYMYA